MGYKQGLIQNKVLKNEDDVLELQRKRSLINQIVNQFYVDDMMNGKMLSNGVLSEDNGKFIGIQLWRRKKDKRDLTADIVIRVRIIYEGKVIYDEVFSYEQLVTKEMILDSVKETIQHKIDCYYKGL